MEYITFALHEYYWSKSIPDDGATVHGHFNTRGWLNVGAHIKCCYSLYPVAMWLLRILVHFKLSWHKGYIKTKPEGVAKNAILIFPECTGYNQFTFCVTSVSGEFAHGCDYKSCC